MPGATMTSPRPSLPVGTNTEANSHHQTRAHAFGQANSARVRPAAPQPPLPAQPIHLPRPSTPVLTQPLTLPNTPLGAKVGACTTPRRPARHKSIAQNGARALHSPGAARHKANGLEQPAHAGTSTAVQFNKVYPAPGMSTRRFEYRAAPDKRSSLAIRCHSISPSSLVSSDQSRPS